MIEHRTTTDSPEATERLALAIGQNLRGGEVIELVSDLGGGKTTFTRGLVAGLASPDPVSSPTFTISREYAGGRLYVYHFDFYRLQDPGIIADQVAEVAEDPNAVVLIEWADVVHHVLPPERIIIHITAGSDYTRAFGVTYPDKFAYVFKDILD